MLYWRDASINTILLSKCLLDYLIVVVDLVDCEVSQWSDYGECSAMCGPGIRMRNRTIITYPLYGGLECPSLSETEPCEDQPCCELTMCLYLINILDYCTERMLWGDASLSIH